MQIGTTTNHVKHVGDDIHCKTLTRVHEPPLRDAPAPSVLLGHVIPENITYLSEKNNGSYISTPTKKAGRTRWRSRSKKQRRRHENLGKLHAKQYVLYHLFMQLLTARTAFYGSSSILG